MFDFLYSLIDKLPEVIQIMLFFFALIGGIVLLIKGADAFVEGAATLARRLGIPAVIIGITIVAFGTSLPETAVSVSASLNGNADIAIGNVIGSNICNILLVLGISTLFVPIIIRKKAFFIDLIIMVLATVFLLASFIFFPHLDSYGIIRLEGLFLLICIIAYIVYNIVTALKNKTKEKQTTSDNAKNKLVKTIIILLIGLIGVIVGGEFVTYGASNLAITIGISEAIVGLTIVAVCTSLPELVSTFVAARKKENDIALGNVIGSNIFNIFFILGLAATISPIAINKTMIFNIILLIVLSLIIFAFYFFKGKITKKYGIMMLSVYSCYIAFLVVCEFL